MKITQTKDIRAANRWEIMRQVLGNYPISRADIGRRTGLNKATVSTIVKEWIDAGLLMETELGHSEGGANPSSSPPSTGRAAPWPWTLISAGFRPF